MPKFIIKTPKFIDGTLHQARPDLPVVVEVHDKWQAHKDPDFIPYKGGEPEAEKLGKHFNEEHGGHVMSSVQHHSEPTKEGKSKRTSDKEPI